VEQESCKERGEFEARSFQAALSPLIRSVSFAYLFERFPSFSQTFCYREVAELDRQGEAPSVFSIRKPANEPPQDWDEKIVARVQYLPDEAQLTREIDAALKEKQLDKAIADLVAEWGRRPDFLRLYQAIHVGSRLRKSGITHVHAHFAGMAARTAYWINKFFGISFSFTAHANDIFAPQEFEVGLEKLFGAANHVITVSDYAAKFLRDRFPQDTAKVRRVYNGLDLSKFERADFSKSVPTIVAIGRLIEKKSFADLIRACAVLKKRGRDFHCEIIGEGPLENELHAQIAELDLESCVRLAGPKTQTEIAHQLANASVFVLPAVVDPDGARDNLPTVIMEAMAAGLPVVSTPVGGIPEMVVHDETGSLVPPGDYVALADAIEKVTVDPALARKLGQAGRERAETLFSIEKNVGELKAILL
jgi:glycosyltransferase involved in cell wall biosynthesis